jgi:hypothetical protein
VKLDQTFIAIRERSVLEIFDLALQVVRQHCFNLICLLAVGALPWVAIDWILIGWMVDARVPVDGSQFFYYWMMTILVISQSQLGTSLITYYLGQSMFIAQPSIQQTIRESFWKSPFFWWLHGGLRMVIPIIGLVSLVWTYGESMRGGVAFFITVLVILGVMVRAFRPFVTEILLLEKTPVRTGNPRQIRFAQRSSSLHQSSNDLLSRFIVGLIFYPLLCGSLFAALNIIDEAVALQPSLEFSLKSIYWVVAMWLTAAFAAVVRFLSYIDVRIRQEGWAVELNLRAEGIRLSGGDA